MTIRLLSLFSVFLFCAILIAMRPVTAKMAEASANESSEMDSTHGQSTRLSPTLTYTESAPIEMVGRISHTNIITLSHTNEMLSVFVTGTLAYVGQLGNVLIYDVSNPQ